MWLCGDWGKCSFGLFFQQSSSFIKVQPCSLKIMETVFGDFSDNPWQKHFFQQHVHINYFHFHFMLNRMPHRSWLVMLHCLHERCQMNDCVSSSRTVAKSKGIFPGILYHVLLPSSPLSRLHLRLPPRSYHHPFPSTVLVFLWIPCIWSFLGNAHGRAVEWTTGNKASWFPQQLEEAQYWPSGWGQAVEWEGSGLSRNCFSMET